jgi:hypothetical protein
VGLVTGHARLRRRAGGLLPEPWVPAGQFLGLDAAGLLNHAVADAAVADDESSYAGLLLSPGGRGRAFRRWERRAGVVPQRPALPGRGQPGRSPVDGGWACRLERPVLQILAEHPEFALSGTDAVTAGMATDAAAYDAEKAITFDGWQSVHQRGPRAARCRSRGQPT